MSPQANFWALLPQLAVPYWKVADSWDGSGRSVSLGVGLYRLHPVAGPWPSLSLLPGPPRYDGSTHTAPTVNRATPQTFLSAMTKTLWSHEPKELFPPSRWFCQTWWSKETNTTLQVLPKCVCSPSRPRQEPRGWGFGCIFQCTNCFWFIYLSIPDKNGMVWFNRKEHQRSRNFWGCRGEAG